jgi:hypothetical protein
MAKVIVVLMIAICSLIVFSSCGQAGLVTNTTPQSPPPSASPSPTATTVASELVVSPEDVLAGLPVYPGATPTTSDNPFYGQPVVSFFQPVYTGNLIPKIQSASAQYTVQALPADVLSWYPNELSAKGYRKFLEIHGSGGDGISFFLSSQLLLSVEVHVHTVPNAVPSATVFELLVIYRVPLPKPPEEILPDDIDSITVTYYSSVEPIVKTLTESQVIMKLVGMVNTLPVRPDYMYFGGLSDGPYTIFSLVFHLRSRGDITVTDIVDLKETGIHVGDYPILEDRYELFREAVEQILGIQGTYPANN